MERILICRQDKLGDFVMGTAVFSAVREAFPEAKIGVLVDQPHAELAAMHPARLDVQVGPNRLKISEAPAWAARWRREKWEAILLIPENTRAWSYAVRLSNCPIRMGVCDKHYRNFFNVRETRRWTGRRHEVQLALHVAARGLGRPMREHPMWLPQTEAAEAAADELLGGERGFVAVGIGTGGTAPVWPLEHWRLLLARMNREAKIVFFGPGSQSELAKSVSEGLDVLNLTGRTGLLELGSLLARARMTVCGNTGLLHASAAVKTPVMVIETNVHDRYWELRWGAWKSPSWHVLRKNDGSLADAADAIELFEYAWPLTGPDGNPATLRWMSR